MLGWQLEAAKLLWAQGQSAIATGTARALLAEAQTALGPASGTVARISTLLGSWLAHSRYTMGCFVQFHKCLLRRQPD